MQFSVSEKADCELRAIAACDEQDVCPLNVSKQEGAMLILLIIIALKIAS